mgnify:CR=1 FL=1|jgi:hypothetical protein
MAMFDELNKTGQRIFVVATIIFTVSIAAMLVAIVFKI